MRSFPCVDIISQEIVTMYTCRAVFLFIRVIWLFHRSVITGGTKPARSRWKIDDKCLKTYSDPMWSDEMRVWDFPRISPFRENPRARKEEEEGEEDCIGLPGGSLRNAGLPPPVHHVPYDEIARINGRWDNPDNRYDYRSVQSRSSTDTRGFLCPAWDYNITVQCAIERGNFPQRDIPAGRSTGKNFYHWGVCVKIKPHAIISRRNVRRQNYTNASRALIIVTIIVITPECHWLRARARALANVPIVFCQGLTYTPRRSARDTAIRAIGLSRTLGSSWAKTHSSLTAKKAWSRDM